MTVSISNMSQTWMSNSNVYSAISMSVSTLGVGPNANSKLLSYKVDANATFDVYASGVLFMKAIPVANLPRANVIGAGGRATVTDANQRSFLATVYSGGANVVPVFSDGSSWKIG